MLKLTEGTVTDQVIHQQPARQLALGQWSCCAQPPHSISHPDELIAATADWLVASVPGTVASVLRDNGQWSFDEPPHIDESDWWFRTQFQVSERDANADWRLCLDGLATLADVWLNGHALLSSDNMFRSHHQNVSRLLQPDNELVICFRSLTQGLKQKRPRPRWKTNLVDQQQLRWIRTTLQGRIPGWSPVAPAIGPWREIRLESSPVSRKDIYLHSRLDHGRGVVSIRVQFDGRQSLRGARLRVGSIVTRLVIESDISGNWISGELSIDAPQLWWPHTHGIPHLYPCELLLETDGGPQTIPCPSIGFRQLDVVSPDEFAIRINDEEIYCRGACWTISDLLALDGTDAALEQDLRLASDAGINMLRVGGTMIYESDRFYELCDQLGILIWQDFMFANMDYPVDDDAFHDNIAQEAVEQLRRLAVHPCVAVYCGNSEVEQQAAMLGMPRDLWRNHWFGKDLPRLCAQQHPGTTYIPSTPCGGILPFHTNTGVSHFYGIGAYLRPTTDLRQADVKFTSECLGFANIPEPQTVDLITDGSHPVMHHPKWKRRVPRDTGAGWDFEDVRDHYLRELYGVDPVQLRSWDMPRYIQLARTVPGEMMARTFAEWRSTHSRNQGGLVWFYKDLWPAAGWGIIDSTGIPKSSYYYLKRLWNNRQVTITDEGLNGLHLHLINESANACGGAVEVALYKEPDIVVARQSVPVQVPARGRQLLSADEILQGFYDISYSYRFGPPHHDLVFVTWFDEHAEVISESIHHIRRRDPSIIAVEIEGTAERVADSEYQVTLKSRSFLHSVRLTAKGFLPSDNYFHLPPQRSKTIRFRPVGAGASTFKVDVEALNVAAPTRIVCPVP